MKTIHIALVAIIAFELAAFAGFASGQTPTAPIAGNSITFSGPGGGTCDTPGPQKTILCQPTSGDLLFSANGGALTSLRGPRGLDGTNGKDGAPGTPGATVSLNGKTCTATFTSMTQDGAGGGALVLKLGVCQ
jgi:hypothetical protein